MKPLIFTCKAVPEQRLDLSALVPRRVDRLSAREIAAIEIQTTRDKVTVGDVFRLRAGAAETVCFEGATERFDNIGRDMAGGQIIVEGSVGEMGARLMRAGHIEMRGNAGPWAASGLKGGTVIVHGSAGDWLAGPLAGEMAGMRGGLVHVHGTAGEMAGDRMRRGTIVIDGSTGRYPGSRMIAGTLVIGGEAGELPGYLLRRGTIFLARAPKSLSPTFIATGEGEPVFRMLLARALEQHGIRVPWLVRAGMRRLSGDTAVGGSGEMFIAK